MVRIKVCGITNREDALAACELGADALGFIFYNGSKRYVEPEKAKAIVSELPPFISTVGVFVNQDVPEIESVVETVGIDTVQLHGDESADFCSKIPLRVIKAVRVKEFVDADAVELYPVQAILFDKHADDMYGGTGKSFDWSALSGIHISKHIILSGGLTDENVSEAIETVRPYAVDVSSGVEDSPGKKNHMKIRNFIEAVRNGK